MGSERLPTSSAPKSAGIAATRRRPIWAPSISSSDAVSRRMRATSRFSIAADYKPQGHGDTEAGKQGTARFAVAPLLLIPCLVLSPRLWATLSFLGMQLDDVAVRKRMVPVDHLAFEFAVAPDARVLEMREDFLVHALGEVCDGGSDPQHVGLGEVGLLAGLFGIDSEDPQHAKYRALQLLEAFARFGRNGHGGEASGIEFGERVKGFARAGQVHFVSNH